MAIQYQSAVVITEGVKLNLGLLETNSRTPIEYTLTTTAIAAIDAESISVTSNVADLLIQAGTKLAFGAVIATVTEDTVVDTTATTVPVEALSAQIASGATADTKALLTVLGLTEASPNAETTNVDTTNFLSGFGQEMVVTGVNRTIQCSGNVIVGDRAMDLYIKPLILDDAKARRELYAELEMPSGEKFEGAAKIMNFSSSVGLRDIQKYSFQLQFQGLSFAHTPATTYTAVAQDEPAPIPAPSPTP